jgi:hypothetical protein
VRARTGTTDTVLKESPETFSVISGAAAVDGTRAADVAGLLRHSALLRRAQWCQLQRAPRGK